jgi:uncharacterized membrane-anchored protein
MIRALVFIAFLGALATAAAWLADRPGEVEIVWLGQRISTSVAAALVGVAMIAFAIMALWTIVRFVFRLPDLITLSTRARRRTRGFAAVSRGMVAVGAGDPAAARRHAIDAQRLLGTEPLALLLRAQAAQISGDRGGAEAAFNSMLDEPETRVLGLRGLFIEARRKGDGAAATGAARSQPSTGACRSVSSTGISRSVSAPSFSRPTRSTAPNGSPTPRSRRPARPCSRRDGGRCRILTWRAPMSSSGRATRHATGLPGPRSC